MSSSGGYKRDSSRKMKTATLPMENIFEKVYTLSETVHQTFQLTRRLKGEVIEILPQIKMYIDLALELDQSRFSPLLKLTLERFEHVLTKKEYFESEMQKIVDASKKFLQNISKSEYKRMSMNDPKGMLEWLIKENRSAAELQNTALNLKECWDEVKEDVLFEIMDCIRLAQELYTKLWGTESNDELEGDSDESCIMKMDPQLALHPNVKVAKKFLKMSEDQSNIQSSIVVFLKTLNYAGDLKQQLEKEVSEITCKLESFYKLQLDVKKSGFAPLLLRLETRLGLMEQKVRYFLSKLETVDDENAELIEVAESPEIATQKIFPEPKAMLKKTIEINRSAAQFMVTVRRLKDEWETRKEEIGYEATECVRLMEELHSKLKKTSLNQNEK